MTRIQQNNELETTNTTASLLTEWRRRVRLVRWARSAYGWIRPIEIA